MLNPFSFLHVKLGNPQKKKTLQDLQTFIIHNLYSSPDIIRQVKANEVGGACGTHGREEKSVQGFGGKARRKETTWKTKA
jgi:hypothetical protein